MFLTVKISSYVFFFVLIICFLGGVMAGISYVKGVRNEGRKFSLTELLVTGILGAGGVLLVYLISKEIRTDDRLSHHKVLWFNLAFFLIHILAIVLLFHFGIIKS